MKKTALLLLPLAIGSLYAFTACSKTGIDIAMIAGNKVGTPIEDGSFNESCRDAVRALSTAYEYTWGVYQPEDTDTESYVTIMETAIKDGAKLLVCVGALLEDSVPEVAPLYPDVYFLCIDFSITDYDNVRSILFKEEESGYLAGYALASEGMKKVAFMGGYAVESVVRYGMGFLIGLNEKADTSSGQKLEVIYSYADTFIGSTRAVAVADTWYEEEAEAIFACGGSLTNSVVTSSEKAEGRYVVGVDVDQGDLSKNIITSAMKDIQVTLIKELVYYLNYAFVGKKAVRYGVSDGGVELPTEDWRFQTFSLGDYEYIFQRMENGSRKITVDYHDGNDMDSLMNFASTLSDISVDFRDVKLPS